MYQNITSNVPVNYQCCTSNVPGGRQCLEGEQRASLYNQSSKATLYECPRLQAKTASNGEIFPNVSRSVARCPAVVKGHEVKGDGREQRTRSELERKGIDFSPKPSAKGTGASSG